MHQWLTKAEGKKYNKKINFLLVCDEEEEVVSAGCIAGDYAYSEAAVSMHVRGRDIYRGCGI